MAHRILFVCVGNSCRSQMAEAFARRHGLESASAGTMPAHEVSAGAIACMQEVGLDLRHAEPKRLDFLRLADFETIISMGPGVAQTSPDLHAHEDWGIEDPVNQDYAVYRRVRDQIEARVKAMAREMREWGAVRQEEGALVAT